MGVMIERCKTNSAYRGRTHAADAFATDGTGRLVPHRGEVFETMPLGSLDLLAFVNMGSAYQRNPETAEGMQWEIGFSDKRVSFFSPDCAKHFNNAAKNANHVTLGFYYYHELRSLSLASAKSEGGPYVSMVYTSKFNWLAQIPMGVRLHGKPEPLRIFATALVARLLEHYDQICSSLGVDARELKTLLDEVNAFDFDTGTQTDLFLSAKGNMVHVTKRV